jgi:hypothetical protein
MDDLSVPLGPSEISAFNGLAQGLGENLPTDLHEISAPPPKPFLAVVKIAYCAICHSIL